MSYIDRKSVNASYRPTNHLMSPGLKRAREPFRLRNAATGILLGAGAVGIWAYSISAVKQDVFDDVDEEARALAHSGASSTITSLEDQKKGAEPVTSTAPGATPDPSYIVQPPRDLPPLSPAPHKGLLAKHFAPRQSPWLDPATHTLVWGAPPVEDMGKLRLRSSK